jgi:hypothetical protein
MGIDMKKLFAMLWGLLLFSTCSCAVAGEVILIGHYSNQKATTDEDPHIVSGYWISLYRQDDIVFGDIGVATGSLEPVQGRLYDIVFDPVTKNLSFKAKYSRGIEAGKGIPKEGRESHNLMLFSGKLERTAIAGTVVLKDGYNMSRPEKKTFESMKRVKFYYKPASMQQWAAFKNLDMQW